MRSFLVRACTWAAVALVTPFLAACEEHPEIEITQTRQNGERLKVNATTMERFSRSPSRQAPTPADMAAMFEWTVPAGWEQLPTEPLRIINLKAGAAECFLTILNGGDPEGNINRWRRQIGQAALPTAEVEKLKTARLFGRAAYLFDAEGTYGDKPDQRIRAVYIQLPMAGISVKLQGPKDAVAKALPGFEAFCGSLGFKSQAAAGGAGAAGEGFDPAAMQSDVPEGWKAGGGSSMRHVTYATGGSSECYVTFLGPNAGDWRANVVRWVGQIGAPALDEAAFMAMPTIQVMGKPVPVLEAHGDKGSMLGVMVAGPARVMFVKMTGTREEVVSQKANFLAYCKSLRIEK